MRPFTPEQLKPTDMHFLDDSLPPENQDKRVITVALYTPEWEPSHTTVRANSTKALTLAGWRRLFDTTA